MRTSEKSSIGGGDLRRTIGLGQAVALYVGAVLGAGVLALPGQAASMAGPASLLAWVFVGLLGLPLALTFAALATRFPDAGGVATYVRRAFGDRAGGIAGWWYFAAVAIGHVIVPLTGGYYVAAAFGVDQWFAYPFAALILVLALVSNLAGLRLSARMQLALAIGVALLLAVTTMTAVPDAAAADFTPFAPHGLAGIGSAAVVLFFAFAGWEAIAHLAGEFRDVGRDLRRATGITVAVVLTLYAGVAFAVIATGSYGTPQLDRVAVGRVLGSGLGLSAATAGGVVAVVISLGTTNAFMAAISRLGYALARDGWMPSPLARLTSRQVPAVAACAVAFLGGLGLLIAAGRGWGTEALVTVPSTLVLITYLIGTAAGVRLLTGNARLIAVVAFALTALVAPFAADYLVVPVVIALLALGYRSVADRLGRKAG